MIRVEYYDENDQMIGETEIDVDPELTPLNVKRCLAQKPEGCEYFIANGRRIPGGLRLENVELPEEDITTTTE